MKLLIFRGFFYYFVISLLTSSFSSAQNLVPNPGFEKTSLCPDFNPSAFGFYDSIGIVFTDSWGKFSYAYYMNTCANTPSSKRVQYGVPKNVYGFQHAHSGNGYAMIGYIWKQVLEVRLKEPLKKDSLYYVEFYANLANSSNCASYVLSAAFSPDSMSRRSWPTIDEDEAPGFKKMYEIKPQITNLPNVLLDDTTNWMLISGTFKANGNERYLLIGYLKRESKFNSLALSTPEDFKKLREYNVIYSTANYYIDDVVVILNSQKNDIGMMEVFPGSRIILNDIKFRFNSYEIDSASTRNLDMLVNILKERDSLKLEIGGHSDNIGNVKQNLLISEKRAMAIKKYLIGKGVAGGRIIVKGYGSSVPVAPNSTEEGRSKNRRIEILFI